MRCRMQWNMLLDSYDIHIKSNEKIRSYQIDGHDSHTQTHTNTQTHTHTRTHTQTQTHAHTYIYI